MALVEFALVLLVLLVVLFGVVDFGKAFNYWIDETHLANQGARFAAVNKNPNSGGGTLQEWVKSHANTTELRDGGTSSVADALVVCIEFPDGTSNVGDPVKVSVTSSYSWMSFLVGEGLVPSSDITGGATMRLEARPTNFSAGCTT